MRKILYYITILIIGVINAILSPYLYYFFGSLVFRGGEEQGLALFIGKGIPFLYMFFLVFEIPIISLLTYLLTSRINKNTKRISFIIILILFTIIQIATIFIPRKIEQVQETRENPIITGEKQYDFSQTVIFNDRDSAKSTPIFFEDNKIVWEEQTKEFPPYTENVWDVFLFEFYPEQSKGVTTKVSNFDNAKEKAPESIGLFEGQVYWVQDKTLYHYDPNSKRTELVLENVASVLAKYQDILVLEHFSPDRYGINAKQDSYFTYNLSNKEEKDINLLNPVRGGGTFAFCISSPLIYYTTNSKGIRSFDIASKRDESLLSFTEEGLPLLMGCSNDYVVYSPSGLSTEIRVYQMNIGEDVFATSLGQKYHMRNWGKVVENDFYYSLYSLDGKNQIVRLNLLTKEEKIIFSTTDNLDEWGWNTNGKYLIYNKHVGDEYSYDEHLYLQKIK